MRRRLKTLTKLLAVCAICAVIFAAWVWFMPFDRALLSAQNITSTRIVDRYGRGLREVLGSREGRSRTVKIDEISPHMIAATVHAEDRRFWSHHGLDPRAIARASWQNISRFEVVSGASTLSQQLVKMLLAGSRSRTLANKFEEAVLAVRLEKAATKREILGQYLNRAPYGNQLFGVSAAAWMYFDKPPSQLSLAESALLAGIPSAPSLNNPYANRERAVRAQRRILGWMRERDAITQAQYESALAEKLVILKRDGRVLAPHFTEYVLQILAEDAPTADSDTRPHLIETTLDLGLQKTVQGIVRAELSRLADKNVHQAAVLVLDTQSNEVLAWVGSQDYWDPKNEGANDGVMMQRPPGSALKPFIYGLFFEQGHSAADILADFPREFPAAKGIYIPKNYDGRYHGPVSARDALASSLNIPAVMVAQQVGVQTILDRLRALGIDTLEENEEFYGLGIALGNGEVRLRDLTAAYATLGRMGHAHPLRIFLNDATSDTEKPTADGVFPEESAYILLDILSDDAARARGFGRYSALYFPYRVAAKTGTSAGFRDNWTFGVTPDYTVGVWAGNFDAAPMHHSSGITGAAPIMRQVMQALYPGAANAADVRWYAPPEGIETHSVCTLSGHTPGPDCPTTRRELFTPDTGAPRPCELHRRVAIDTRTGRRAAPDCPAEFIEERVLLDVPADWRDWARRRGEPVLNEPPNARSEF